MLNFEMVGVPLVERSSGYVVLHALCLTILADDLHGVCE